jgi:nucleoside-diphosphate-sugar epimerase
MARLLIAGCGYVGGALAASASARGETVFGLRRTQRPLPAGVGSVVADLAEPASLAALPGDIDSVVYAASADERSEVAYRRAYVDGPLTLLRHLERRGDPLRRFLLVSSTGVYGQADGSWIDEDTPTLSRGTGAVLEEGERRCLESAASTVVLRLGGIYGPGRRNLIDRVLSGQAGCPGGVPVYTNRIHLDDIVAAIEHLLAAETPSPVYLGVDHEPADTCTVVRWLAEQTGAPAPLAIAAEPVRTNKRCRNDRLVASGFRFRYPTFREGYTQVLERLGLLRTRSAGAGS